MPVRPTLELSAEDAAILLNEGLVGVNRAQMLRRGPGRPRVRDLIASGQLRYSPVDPDEHWQTYEDVLGAIQARGVALADCEDLAGMAAAEEDLDGDTGARTTVYRTGPNMNHVVVASPRFGLLDPSISAGMGAGDGLHGVSRSRCPNFGCVPTELVDVVSYGGGTYGPSPLAILTIDLLRRR